MVDRIAELEQALFDRDNVIEQLISDRDALREENGRLTQRQIGLGTAIEDLRLKLKTADLAVATFIGELGYATGHGDTIADMLAEVEAMIAMEKGR